MRRGLRTLAVSGAVSLAFVITPSSASATDGPVTVAASGPAKVVTSSDTSTGRIVATFVVSDTSLTATGATICRTHGNVTRQGCHYERFDGLAVSDDLDDDYYVDHEDDYDEFDEYTRWDIGGQPGEWTVSYPIGFDEIPREDCLRAAWQKKPFSADIEVMNDAGVVLATGSWTYQVVCTGIEGASTGPERTRVYAGRSSTSRSFTFLVLDSKRILSSYRVCRYSSVDGHRYLGCDREMLTASHRTKNGNWLLSYTLSWRPMGPGLCSVIGRKWPQEGVRIEFYDRNLRKQLSLYRATRLDC